METNRFDDYYIDNIEYAVDTGTTNFGLDYEEKVFTFFSLKALQNFDKFWLSSNMFKMVPLDDVILLTKENNENVAYLCQIKHGEKVLTGEELNGINLATGKQIKRQNKKLSMLEYYNKFKTIKKNIHQYIPEQFQEIHNFKIIIFTNRPIKENDAAFIPYNQIKLFNTKDGKVHKLNSKSFPNNDLGFYMFLNSVSLYSNQANITGLEEEMVTCMNKIVGDSSTKDSLTDYINYIRNWMKIPIKRIGLNDKFVNDLMHFSVLKSNSIPINFSQTFDKQMCGNFLWEDIKSKRLQINQSNLPYVTNMILNDLVNFNLKEDELSFLPNILFENYTNTDATQKYILGCFTGKFALALKRKCSLNFKKVPFKYISIVDDLDSSKNLPQIGDSLSHLLKENINLSCGRSIALHEIFNNSKVTFEAVSSKLSVSDALTLLNNQYEANVESDILLERKIRTVFIKIEALNSAYDDVFIINISKLQNESHFEEKSHFEENYFQKESHFEQKNKLEIKAAIEFMNLNKDFVCNINEYEQKFKYVFVRKDSEFKEFRNPYSKNVHYVKIIDKNLKYIQWVGTNGDVSKLEQFQSDELNADIQENNLIDLKDIFNYFQQSLLVISGVPGIGKSTAMEQIARIVPPNIWVLHVDLIKYYGTFQKIKSNSLALISCLNHFFEYDSVFLREIFNEKLKNKEMLILLDGLDEIAPNFTNIVCDIIKYIKSEGFKIIITTRTVLQKEIEDTFKTFSLILCPFSEKQQEEYLITYIDKNIRKDDNDDLNYLNILSNLYQIEPQFRNIPLHMKLLAEILFKNVQSNVSKDLSINLYKIYDEYTNNKLDMFIKRYNNMHIDIENIVSYHSYFAIKTIFKQSILYESEMKYFVEGALKANVSALKRGAEKTGFLISNEKEIFIHRTIAEFYAAKFLWDIVKIKNEESLLEIERKFAMGILRTEILTKECNTMKMFFQSIVSEGCKIHELILSNKISDAKTIIQNDISQVNTVNKYNQTILHTIILKYDVEEKNDRINIDVAQILDLCTDSTKILEKKDDLGFSSLNYINNIISLSSLKITLLVIPIDGENNCFISYNKPMNIIQFIFSKIANKNNLEYLLSILPNSKVINLVKFDSNEFSDGSTKIHHAVRTGLLEIIRNVISSTTDINVKDNQGLTPLHWAVEDGNLEVIKFLISKGANSNVEDNNKSSCVHYAVRTGNIENIKYICSLTNNINLKNKSGFTPLGAAVVAGNLEVIEFLIDCGADAKNNEYIDYAVTAGNINVIEFLIPYTGINSKNQYGQTPLHLAIGGKQLKVINFLIINGADPTITDTNEYTCIHYAVRTGCIDIIKYIIQYTKDINIKDKHGVTPLVTAIQFEHLDVIKYLISIGANPSIGDNNESVCMHHAVRSGNIDIIKYFIPYTNDINVKNKFGTTPLMSGLVGSKNLDVIYFLINKGADVTIADQDESRCIHYAALTDSIDIIKYFIENTNININIKNKMGNTPLIFAIRHKNLNIIKFLVNNGADLESTNVFDSTCLHHAAITGCVDVIHYFITDTNVNIKNKCGETPLMWAIESGNLDAIKFLISKGGDPSITNDMDGTCLHHAATSGSIDIIKYFLPFVNSINIRDKLGYTPLNFAVQVKNLEVIDFLINIGADTNNLDCTQSTYMHWTATTLCMHKTFKYLSPYINEFNIKNKFSKVPPFLSLIQSEAFQNLKFISNLTNCKCIKYVPGTNCVDVIKYFIPYTHNINIKNIFGVTPLTSAIISRNIDAIKFLISIGAKPDTDTEDSTCLHYAAKTDSIDIVKYFLKYTDDINIKNKFGQTPLMWAVEAKCLDVIKYLISIGADAKSADSDGSTILHYVAREDSMEITNYFLQNNPDKNISDNSGRTPLHLAIKNLVIFKLFIENGFEPKCKDNNGFSCKDYADKEGLTEISMYLSFFDMIR